MTSLNIYAQTMPPGLLRRLARIERRQHQGDYALYLSIRDVVYDVQKTQQRIPEDAF